MKDSQENCQENFRFLKDFNLNGLPKIFFVKISLGVHREKSKTDWQQQLSEAGCE